MYLLDKNCISIVDRVDSWQQGLNLSTQILLDQNCITVEYIKAIYKSIKQYGPYILLTPELIMPHARPEQGVLQTGISLLKLNNSIEFFDNDIKVILSLASIDSVSHIEYIKQIVDIISDETKYKHLLDSNNIEEIYELFNS